MTKDVISLRTRRPVDEMKTTFVGTGQTDENGLEVFVAVVEDGYGNTSRVEITGVGILFDRPDSSTNKQPAQRNLRLMINNGQ